MDSAVGDGLPWKKLTIHINECSGFHIGNKEDKGIILTAAHCTAFDARKNAKNPTLGMYIDNNGAAMIEHVQNLGFSNDTSYADAALLYTNAAKDISSVFLLINPEDLPDNTQLHYYGRTSKSSSADKWRPDMHINDTDSTIKETINAILGDTWINPNFFIGDNYNASKYKFYVRGCTTTIPLEQGDSGGPIGIPFGENKFAVVGLVQVGNFFTSISQCLIRILQLESTIKFNLATYNVETGLIEPNTELNHEFHTKIDRIVELETLLIDMEREVKDLEKASSNLTKRKLLDENITVSDENVANASRRADDAKYLRASKRAELLSIQFGLNKTLSGMSDRIKELERIRMAAAAAPVVPAPVVPAPVVPVQTPPKRTFCNRFFGCFRRTAKVVHLRKRSTRRRRRSRR
jgi:hypothetical protein